MTAGGSECHDRLVIPLSHPLVDRLLAIMDQKHHWAWPSLTRPGLTRTQLLVHFRHEYATYVRDFPMLLARALGPVPHLIDLRRALAENTDEEQTGGFSTSAPPPELFLRRMEGLGFTRAHFDERVIEPELHAAARSYRDWLHTKSLEVPWQAATALLTIFVDGSVSERSVHGGDAWRIVLEHTSDETVAMSIIDTCMEGLARWHRYRDGVAERMGLGRDIATTAPPPVVQSASP